MTSDDRLAAHRADIAKIKAEGRGIMRLGLYRRAAIAGIPEGPLWNAFLVYLRDINNRPDHDRAHCLMCKTTFDRTHPPTALSALCADVPDAANYMIAGICAVCRSRPDVLDKARATLAVDLGVRIQMLNIGTAGRA